ncbi:PepSY domain-containing protein [Bacillus sp. JCM 19034]|uniref:PepSY domain-containing protein n=1 Tax=Bacillus sp. JCM 19034 TaxID=1481928 RepID=UPI000782B93A|nr:PepSY domain-containing protein [Bacillus sp. JCM 19034]
MRKTMMIIVGLALIGGTGIAVSAATSLDTIERVIPVSASEDIDVSTEFGNEMEEGPLVTVKDAKELVLAQFENSHFKELELEKDNGRYVYEIEIKVDGKDGDVYVDAMNGEIIYIDDDLLKDTSEEHRISNERIGEFISAQDALEIAFAISVKKVKWMN